MKSIALFRSTLFDQSWPANDKDPNAIPLGRDLAEYLQTKLSEQGIHVQGPIQGDGGWVVDGDFPSTPFSLFVHWAPIGNPPIDRWVIQPHVRRGVFKSLFGARKPLTKLEPLIGILNATLSQDSRIENLTWMDENQLAAVY